MKSLQEMRRNKRNLGGALKAAAPMALGAINPALGIGASIAIPAIEALLQQVPEQPKLPDVNPYTSMALGGKFIQWNAPSHAKGGQMVDRAGIPSNTGYAEIEKQENMHTDRDGGYVFSDRLKNPMTGNTVAKDAAMANKKFNGDDDLSKNAHAFLMKKYRKLNEKLKMKYGGKKMGDGGFMQGDPPLTSLPAYTPPNYNLGLPYQATVPNPQIQSLAARPTDPSTFKLPDFGVKKFTSSRRGEGGLGKLSGYDAGNIMKIGALAGSAVDALLPSEKEKLQLPDYNPTDQAMKGLGVSDQAIKNELTRGATAAGQTARGASRNFSQLANQLNSIYSGTAARKATAVQQTKSYNDQMKLQMAGHERNKALSNRGEKIRRQEAQSMNDANRRLGLRHLMTNVTQLGTSLQKMQYMKDAMANKNELARMKAKDFLRAMNIINPNIQVDLDKAMNELSDTELSELFKVVG